MNVKPITRRQMLRSSMAVLLALPVFAAFQGESSATPAATRIKGTFRYWTTLQGNRIPYRELEETNLQVWDIIERRVEMYPFVFKIEVADSVGVDRKYNDQGLLTVYFIAEHWDGGVLSHDLTRTDTSSLETDVFQSLIDRRFYDEFIPKTLDRYGF